MKNYTDINILVDRSGSMQSIAEDMLGGLRTFIAKEREAGTDARVSFYIFDDQYENVFSDKDIKDVKDSDFTLQPRGWTALRDALGKTINSVGQRLEKISEADRPNRVLFVTITDGADNRSTEYNIDALKEMIVRQREVYAWDFVFLGANIDSFNAAKSYGIGAASTSNYMADSKGVAQMYSSLNENMRSYAMLDRSVDRGSTFSFADRVATKAAANAHITTKKEEELV